MKDIIADYLAQGYKAAQVASFCDCTEQYISELFSKDEAFKEILREKMSLHTAKRIDRRYESLEENTLRAINSAIDGADINQLTRVLESIARIKQANKTPALHNLSNPTQGITLIFQSGNVPALEVDTNNRVVSIGSQTMMPMPAKAVRDMFNTMEKDNERALSAPAAAGATT